MNEIDVESPETAHLDTIAGALDRLPGPDGHGLSTTDRARIFAFLDDPTSAHWIVARRVSISPRHTLWVATMRHSKVGMYTLPTAKKVLSALRACAAGQIAP